jgi:tetratricopeptide (TPR) repeat protein
MAKPRSKRFTYSCYRFAKSPIPKGCAVGGIIIIAFYEIHRLYFGLRLILGNPKWLAPADITAVALAGTWLLAYAFVLIVSRWFSVWFRYLAWWLSNARILWTVVVVLVLGAALWQSAITARVLKQFSTELIGGGALLVVVYWVNRARRRIVIMPFSNYSGDSTLGECVQGLAPFVVNELSRSAELYASIDQTEPIPIQSVSKRLVPATLTVQDIGEALRGVVSAESKFRFWGLEIPVGAVLGILGRLVQGPRVSGSLHKQEQTLIIIAQMEGGKWPVKGWRVNADELGEIPVPNGSAAVMKMAAQLAYRIFTDLVPSGSPRWEAVKHFSAGLALLRITSRTNSRKEVNLRRAEAAFIAALAQDNLFALCHYNLGVVYNSLAESKSAEAAFVAAAQADPQLAPAYYALAVNHWSAGERSKSESNSNAGQYYRDCVLACEQAIKLQPDNASAWNLRGMAELRIVEQQIGQPLETPEQPRGSDRAKLARNLLQTREIAASIAWRALCRVALRGQSTETPKQTVGACLLNLAVGYWRAKQARQARAVLRQVLHVKPYDCTLYFELGKILEGGGNSAKATKAYEAAVEIESRPDFWAYLAKTESLEFKRGQGHEHKDAAINAAQRALENACWLDEDCLRRVQETFLNAGETVAADVVARIPEVLKTVERKEGEDDRNYGDRMQRLRQTYQGWDWALAQVSVAVGEFEEALARLARTHEGEIRKRGLHSLCARSCRDRGELQQALEYANKAVGLDPEEPYARLELAEVYQALNDFDRAEKELTKCLDLRPEYPYALQLLGLAYQNRAVMFRQVEEKQKALLRAIEIFNSVAEVSKSMETRGWSHFYLGQFHRALLQYDQAFINLKIAEGIGFKPLETKVALGWGYVEAKAYDDVEQAFKSAIAEATKYHHSTKSSTIKVPAMGEDRALNVLLIETYLFLFLARASRGLGGTLPRRLKRYIERRIQRLDKGKAGYLAVLHDCLGLDFFRRGMIDMAISEFEQSVRLKASGIITGSGARYLRLAQAYFAKAQETTTALSPWLAKAREACVNSRETDLWGDSTREIGELVSLLDALGTEKNKTESQSVSSSDGLYLHAAADRVAMP